MFFYWVFQICFGLSIWILETVFLLLRGWGLLNFDWEIVLSISQFGGKFNVKALESMKVLSLHVCCLVNWHVLLELSLRIFTFRSVPFTFNATPSRAQNFLLALRSDHSWCSGNWTRIGYEVKKLPAVLYVLFLMPFLSATAF